MTELALLNASTMLSPSLISRCRSRSRRYLATKMVRWIASVDAVPCRIAPSTIAWTSDAEARRAREWTTMDPPFDVPVDQDAPSAVAGVPLGEDVLVIGPEVGGVGGDGCRARAPQRLLPGSERRFGDRDGHGPGRVTGQVAAARVADLVLAVPAPEALIKPSPGYPASLCD